MRFLGKQTELNHLKLNIEGLEREGITGSEDVAGESVAQIEAICELGGRVRVRGPINGRCMVKFINGLGFKPGKKAAQQIRKEKD